MIKDRWVWVAAGGYLAVLLGLASLGYGLGMLL
jgi:hypothetical protein